jgi:hypothetical protein
MQPTEATSLEAFTRWAMKRKEEHNNSLLLVEIATEQSNIKKLESTFSFYSRIIQKYLKRHCVSSDRVSTVLY